VGYRRAVLFAKILFGLALLYKIADALIPKGHTDVLYYTLYAPKLFHFYGWNTLVHDLVPFLMTGVMELFTLLYFQFTENLGWIHILAQLTTLGLSLVLGALLIRRWIRDPFIGFLAAFSILTFTRSSATFIFPKGDGPAGIFAMIAAYAIHVRWKPWAIGILLGLLPSFKLSGIYPAAVLGLITVVKYRREPRFFLVAGLTALAAFAPTLLRNYIVIGNPVYPALLQKIPGRASPAILEFSARYFSTPPNWDFARLAMSDLLRGKIIFGLWIYFLIRKIGTKDSSLLFLVVAGLGSFLLYVATNGTYQDARFFFASFFILGLFAFLELDRLYRSDRPHFLKTAPGMVLLLALAVVDARLEAAPKTIWNNIRDLVSLPLGRIVDREMAREKPTRDLFPANPGSPKRILSEMTAEGYYLDPAYRLEYVDYSRSAGFIRRCTEADTDRLKAYDYFILAADRNTPCHEKVRREGNLLGTHHEPGPSEIYSVRW
jgi:hypothetical protein